MAADDSSDSGAESVQLTCTRLAHYRETLCAVKPLQSSSSNTALVLTRQQHIELLNVCIRIVVIIIIYLHKEICVYRPKQMNEDKRSRTKQFRQTSLHQSQLLRPKSSRPYRLVTGCG